MNIFLHHNDNILLSYCCRSNAHRHLLWSERQRRHQTREELMLMKIRIYIMRLNSPENGENTGKQ